MTTTCPQKRSLPVHESCKRKKERARPMQEKRMQETRMQEMQKETQKEMQKETRMQKSRVLRLMKKKTAVVKHLPVLRPQMMPTISTAWNGNLGIIEAKMKNATICGELGTNGADALEMTFALRSRTKCLGIICRPNLQDAPALKP